mmetsp:Transcript_61873/g.152348  ORF Transcript_61873/g.152348 Transcript_61873/m.152348 type:complete len:414 (-) Transcript_61873:284-1525(-)
MEMLRPYSPRPEGLEEERLGSPSHRMGSIAGPDSPRPFFDSTGGGGSPYSTRKNSEAGSPKDRQVDLFGGDAKLRLAGAALESFQQGMMRRNSEGSVESASRHSRRSSVGSGTPGGSPPRRRGSEGSLELKGTYDDLDDLDLEEDEGPCPEPPPRSLPAGKSPPRSIDGGHWSGAACFDSFKDGRLGNVWTLPTVVENEKSGSYATSVASSACQSASQSRSSSISIPMSNITTSRRGSAGYPGTPRTLNSPRTLTSPRPEAPRSPSVTEGVIMPAFSSSHHPKQDRPSDEGSDAFRASTPDPPMRTKTPSAGYYANVPLAASGMPLLFAERRQLPTPSSPANNNDGHYSSDDGQRCSSDDGGGQPRPPRTPKPKPTDMVRDLKRSGFFDKSPSGASTPEHHRSSPERFVVRPP